MLKESCLFQGLVIENKHLIISVLYGKKIHSLKEPLFCQAWMELNLDAVKTYYV